MDINKVPANLGSEKRSPGSNIRRVFDHFAQLIGGDSLLPYFNGLLNRAGIQINAQEDVWIQLFLMGTSVDQIADLTESKPDLVAELISKIDKLLRKFGSHESFVAPLPEQIPTVLGTEFEEPISRSTEPEALKPETTNRPKAAPTRRPRRSKPIAKEPSGTEVAPSEQAPVVHPVAVSFRSLLELNLAYDPSRSWVANAYCAGSNTEDFFGTSKWSIKSAKEKCYSCKVARSCLAAALVNDEHYGVWGQMSQPEIQRLRRDIGLKRTRKKE